MAEKPPSIGRRQYLTIPGKHLFPSKTTFPLASPSVDEDTKIVKGADGACWYRLNDADISAITLSKTIQARIHKVVDDTPVPLGKLTANGTHPSTAVAEAIAAASGQFIQLDVAQLRAGTATIHAGVIDKLWAGGIRAQFINSKEIVTGDMIARGTVTASNIVASGELTAKVGKFLKVTSDQIATNAVTADKIQAGAVDAQAIQAGAVTTRALAADAIDGMVITGATLQNEHGWEGLKISNGHITGYDTNGTQKLYLDTDYASWTAPGVSNNRFVIDATGRYKSRVTTEWYGNLSGYGKDFGSIFMTGDDEISGDHPYTPGAFVVAGAERSINSSGRADLQLGPGSRFSLSTTWGSDSDTAYIRTSDKYSYRKSLEVGCYGPLQLITNNIRHDMTEEFDRIDNLVSSVNAIIGYLNQGWVKRIYYRNGQITWDYFNGAGLSTIS